MGLASTGNQPQPEGRYEALADSAVSFVERHGNSVHEDALVAHVFGKSASPKLWRSLLQSALAAESRLSYTADGRWMLTAGSQAPPLAGESLLPRFVALDVETTGLKPSRQRVIEVALIRYEHGAETARFNQLVDPGRPIPAYISKLTGLRDDDVAGAATFADLAQEIVGFIGGDVVVGHNVGFDIGFLNAELRRARFGQLVNDSIDTLALATKMVPGLRRPSLDRVAKAVGVPPRRLHRAAVDAEMTAEAALRLEARARAQGVASFDALKAMASPTRRQTQETVGRGRSLVDRSLLDGIPKRPGVYMMRDGDGRVIYVGKAKNLRERVGTYFSQPLGYARKMDGLLESIARIDTEVVGCELEALLLEAQLVRRYAPRYNTAMRAWEHYPYIRVDVSNRWPRVTLVKDRKDDGARYFGPYRSRSAAKKTVDVINDVLPLRTCTRSFKTARSYGNPCMRLALGKCVGPCVDPSVADEYRAMVHQVIRFLDGDDDALYTVLWEALEHAAERQDFERAEKLRRNLQSVNGVVAGQRELRDAAGQHHLVLTVPTARDDTRELWLVLEGRIWSRQRVSCAGRDDGTGGVDGASERLMTAYQRYRKTGLAPVSRDALDDTHILNRWIAGNTGHPVMTVLDRDATGDEGYWRGLVERAINLPAEALVLDVTGRTVS